MANNEMNVLKVGDSEFEIADAQARQDCSELKDDFYDSLVTDTASGAIASFSDGADNVPVKSLTVDIEPVQSGSGDPSPSNVRPISGWTQAVVTRCGKNLLDVTVTTQTTNGVTFTVHDDGTVTANGTATATAFLELLTSNISFAESTILNGCPSGGGANTYAIQLNGGTSLDDGSGITIAANTTITSVRLRIASGVALNNVLFKPMIRLASDVDATYAHPTIQTVTITLGQTVYGGTLDVTTGVLTVNYKKIAIPKTGWQSSEVASGGRVFLNTANIPSDAVHTAIPFCNAFLGVSSAGGNAEAYEKGNNTFCFRSPTYDRIYIRADQFGTDVSAFETFLNDCEICYKYTNPQTIQLTAQEVRTLLGTNNVFADTGDVSVEYRADTKLYINKVLNA